MKGSEVAGCKQCFYRTGTSVTPHPITGLPHGITALECNASKLTRPFGGEIAMTYPPSYLKAAKST